MEEILQLYREGLTPTAISRRVGCSVGTVQRRIAEAGITRHRTARRLSVRAFVMAKGVQLRLLWAQGLGRPAIAADLEVDLALLSAAIEALDLPPRGAFVADDLTAELLRGRVEGRTWASLGREHGLSPQAVQQRCKRASRRASGTHGTHGTHGTPRRR